MPERRGPSADDQLAPENYRELNRKFYAAQPHDYFGQRLTNLILSGGRHEDLERLMTEGVTFGALKVGGHAGGTGDPAPDSTTLEERAKSAEHFAIAEAEVLAHHVGETLLRLYLAHEFAAGAPPPPCPWLEISRLRSFSRAKDLIRARFGQDTDPDNADNLAAVAQVFHLTDRPARLGGNTHMAPELWAQSVANIEGYLRGFARQFLDRAALYNAAKHGLAVLPSEMSMQLGEGLVIRAEGPIIQYLEIHESDGQPRWSQVNHWVRPDRQMALIYRACQLIEAMWDVARVRYVPEQRRDTFQVRLFGGASWTDLMLSDAEATGGVVIEDMAMDLLYNLTAEEVAAVEADKESEPGRPIGRGAGPQRDRNGG